MEQEKGKTFENFEVEPSPAVWQRIEARLPVKKRRRWLLGWILPGLLIGGLVTGYIAWNGITKNSIAHNEFPAPSFIAERKSDNQQSVEMGNAGIQSQTNDPIAQPVRIPPRKNTNMLTKDRKKISSENTNSIQTTNQSPVAENTTINNDPADNPAMALAGSETYVLLEPRKSSFDISDSRRAIADRDKSDYVRPSYSRWSVYAGFGFTISASSSESNIASDILSSDKAVSSTMLEGGVSYEVSPKIRISLGARRIVTGNEGMAKIAVISRGTPTDPNTIYSLQTTSGDLSGPSTVFNQAYFGTIDTTLFIGVSITGTPQESSTEITVKMRREFTYVEVPLAVMLKLREGKLTPSVGALFSVGRLTDHREFINGQRLKYEYENGLAKMNYSLGIAAGLDLSLGRLGFYLGGFYQKGLKSVTSGEKPFKPYVAGTTAGCRFRF